MNASTWRPKSFLIETAKLVVAAKTKDPELTPVQLGIRFGISHTTVRKILRAANMMQPKQKRPR